MKISRVLFGAVVGALTMAAFVQSASAATYLYDITASDFQYSSGPTGASAPGTATLDIGVTFEPGVTTEPTTSGLTVLSTNLPYSTGGFSYWGAGNTLTVATVPELASFIDTKGSYGVFVYNPTSSSPVGVFEETTSNGEIWIAKDVSIITAVPEPAAWTMMLVGFGALGFAMRRRRGGAAALKAAAA